MSVQVVQGSRLRLGTDPEVVQPSAQVRVELEDAVLDRLPPVSRDKLTDLTGDALSRAHRQQRLRGLLLRRTPESKAEEVPFFWSGHGALVRVHDEPQALLDEAAYARHHTLAGALALDEDVRVVRVAHEAVTATVELPIELVQHDVAEQRRQRSTLRCPLLRAHHHSIRHHHLGLEHPA